MTAIWAHAVPASCLFQEFASGIGSWMVRKSSHCSQKVAGPFRTGDRFFTLEGPPPVHWSPFLAVCVCDNVHSFSSIQLPRVCFA